MPWLQLVWMIAARFPSFVRASSKSRPPPSMSSTIAQISRTFASLRSLPSKRAGDQPPRLSLNSPGGTAPSPSKSRPHVVRRDFACVMFGAVCWFFPGGKKLILSLSARSMVLPLGCDFICCPLTGFENRLIVQAYPVRPIGHRN